MKKPVLILDPGHGGLTSFFYDLDNGVRLSYTWDEVRHLDPSEKTYASSAAYRRWRAGELPVEPRFHFERNGRRVTYGDPGDVSPLDPRICEKDLVLDLARSVHREIGRTLLVKATRDRDGYVADPGRVAFANRVSGKYGAATCLLSLHTESSPDPDRCGIRIRPASQVPDTLIESFELELTRHLREAGKRPAPVDFEAQAAGDLTGLEMPALTVVIGHLSNIADAQRLLERSLRQELARALARAVTRYFAVVGAPARIPHPVLEPAVSAGLSEGLA